MKRRNPTLVLAGLLTIVLLFFAGIVWFNNHYLSSSKYGDYFLSYWVGAHTWLKEGASPYRPELVKEIQNAQASAGSTAAIENFPSPLYTELLFVPFALIDNYPLARALWITFLQVCLVLTVWISIRITGWRLGVPSALILIAFSLTWYHSLAPLVSGNAAIVSALLVALALYAVKAGLDELAGLCLALAAMTPQLVGLMIIFLLLWAISCDRWRLVAWTFGCLVILSLVAALLMPDWMLQYARLVIKAWNDTSLVNTPGKAFIQSWPGLGPQMSQGLSIVLAAILLFEWWLARRKDERWVIWTACLTLTASQWIGLPTSPFSFVILLFPLILILATLEDGWGRAARIIVIALLVLLWAGFWAIFVNNWAAALTPQQNPVMFLPLPLLLLVGLYWVRWRAIRPKRLLISELRALQE